MSTAAATLLPEVEAFLRRSPLAGFVAGKDAESSAGETFVTRDPGTGEKLAEVHHLGASDVDRAVEAAQRAFDGPAWSRLPQNERCVLLHRLADAASWLRTTTLFSALARSANKRAVLEATLPSSQSRRTVQRRTSSSACPNNDSAFSSETPSNRFKAQRASSAYCPLWCNTS